MRSESNSRACPSCHRFLPRKKKRTACSRLCQRIVSEAAQQQRHRKNRAARAAQAGTK